MEPSSPMRTEAFHIQPTLACDRSLMPTKAKMLFLRHASRIRAISGPSMKIACSASVQNRSWFSRGDERADQTGKAGIKVSGNTTRLLSGGRY